MSRKAKVFLDGENLVIDHFSGIGHYTAELMSAVDELLQTDERFVVDIGGYYKKIHRLNRFDFKNFGYRRYPFPPPISNKLKTTKKHPPMELMYGRRVYLFPNYTSAPTPFSLSIPFIYDLSYILHPEYVAKPNQVFLSEQVPISIKRASKILTISENSKKEIIDCFGTNPDDIIVCYPAADTRLFYPRSKKEVAQVKAKYGILEENYIMFLGNIEPRKNLKGLLDAYQQLPKAIRKKYALLLVGAKGWNDSEIHQTIQNMRMDGDRVVQPVDYVEDEDRPAIYSGASLFVYPSHYEGFGIPPLEAMACGTPVVSADNSSLPEAIGDAAVMVNAQDVGSIKNGMLLALKNDKLASELVKKGYAQADKFSYKKSAEILLDTILEII